MVLKKEIYSKVNQEVAEKIPALVAYLKAPNLSKLIEGMLEELIKEMEAENAKVSNSHVQSIR